MPGDRHAGCGNGPEAGPVERPEPRSGPISPPALLPHHHELAGQAPDQPRGHRAGPSLPPPPAPGYASTLNWTPATYPPGVKISDEQMAALPLHRHDWHGDWNYTSVSRAARPGASSGAAARPRRTPRLGASGPDRDDSQRLGPAHRRAGRPLPGPARGRPPHRPRRPGNPQARRRPPPGNDPRRENPGHHHAAAPGSTPARPGRAVRRLTIPSPQPNGRSSHCSHGPATPSSPPRPSSPPWPISPHMQQLRASRSRPRPNQRVNNRQALSVP